MNRKTWLGGLLVCLAGCASAPGLHNPLPVRTVAEVENPIVLLPGAALGEGYQAAFERVLTVLNDYFDIRYSNTNQGEIVCVPKVAPGFEQPWKRGSPDARQRLLATVQTYRNRCVAQLQPNEQGGFLVSVIVYRELLDTPRPASGTAGISIFRDNPTVERQYEILDTSVPAYDGNFWIPKGRDTALEQEILERIQSHIK